MSGKDIEDIWKGDLLGREREAMYLQRYIRNAFEMDKAHETSLVLNINSEWGSGKTWFLERFAKQLKNNHPVVYFNAWENDFTKDALTSFISTVCDDLEREFKDELDVHKVSKLKTTAYKIIKPSLPVLLSALIKHYVGVNLIESEEQDGSECDGDNSTASSVQDVAAHLTSIAASAAMKSFHEEKGGIQKFKQTLSELIQHLKSAKSAEYLPLCIFIDELDRCRPTYAIELLESIKHLFNISGIFFIIASDTKQLAHSIKVVYGQNFNAIGYLKRFFYSEYSLDDPKCESMASYFFSNFEYGEKPFLPESIGGAVGGVSGFFATTAVFFRLSVREQEQVFTIFKNFILTTAINDVHIIFLLFLICLKIKHEEFYDELKANLVELVYWENLNARKDKGLLVDVNIANHLYRDGDMEADQNVKLSDILGYYVSISDGDMEKIRVTHPSAFYLYQEEIYLKINRGGVDRTSRKIIAKNKLSSYFQVLEQAGRIRN